MLRYYSHYTFIYPDIYLKNCIVEIGEGGKISHLYSYQHEIEKTEFYSGLLIFMPVDIPVDMMLITSAKQGGVAVAENISQTPDYACKVYTEDLVVVR